MGKFHTRARRMSWLLDVICEIPSSRPCGTTVTADLSARGLHPAGVGALFFQPSSSEICTAKRTELRDRQALPGTAAPSRRRQLPGVQVLSRGGPRACVTSLSRPIPLQLHFFLHPPAHSLLGVSWRAASEDPARQLRSLLLFGEPTLNRILLYYSPRVSINNTSDYEVAISSHFSASFYLIHQNTLQI